MCVHYNQSIKMLKKIAKPKEKNYCYPQQHKRMKLKVKNIFIKQQNVRRENNVCQ